MAENLQTSDPSIYRRTRNPLYLGMMLAYLGLSVAAGSLWAGVNRLGEAPPVARCYNPCPRRTMLKLSGLVAELRTERDRAQKEVEQ